MKRNKNISVIWLTDGELDNSIRDYCFRILEKNAAGCNIIKVVNKNGKRNIRAIYENILCGLGKAEYDDIYIVEHDCLYPENYFRQLSSPTLLSYSRDVLYLDKNGFFERRINYAPLCTLAGKKELIKEATENKIKILDRGEKIKWIEPGIEDKKFGNCIEYRVLDNPIIDIRHGENFSGSRIPENYIGVPELPHLNSRGGTTLPIQKMTAITL